MNPIETQYRNHKIVIRDEIESNGVMGTLDKRQVSKRIIHVDDVDVTSRCRVSNTDEERT